MKLKVRVLADYSQHTLGPFSWATQKKRYESKPCKKCGKDIVVGETYTNVNRNDGFTVAFHGSFHSSCWQENLALQDTIIN